MMRERLRELRRRLVLKVHGSGSNVTTAPAKELEDQPINPEWIDEGAPRARAHCPIQSEDGTILCGEWDCTAGRFRWTYFADEIVRILEGGALIEIDGKFRQIGPGDTVFFPLGQTVRWDVPKYVRKVFFIRHPGKVVEIMRSFKVLGVCVLGFLSHGDIAAPLLSP